MQQPQAPLATITAEVPGFPKGLCTQAPDAGNGNREASVHFCPGSCKRSLGRASPAWLLPHTLLQVGTGREAAGSGLVQPHVRTDGRQAWGLEASFRGPIRCSLRHDSPGSCGRRGVGVLEREPQASWNSKGGGQSCLLKQLFLIQSAPLGRRPVCHVRARCHLQLALQSLRCVLRVRGSDLPLDALCHSSVGGLVEHSLLTSTALKVSVRDREEM